MLAFATDPAMFNHWCPVAEACRRHPGEHSARFESIAA
jgi:hypothetical protein